MLSFDWGSHLEAVAEQPLMGEFIQGLTRFSRVLWFDMRGVGMSSSVAGGVLPIESWMDDLLAVMDAEASDKATLLAQGSAVADGRDGCRDPSRTRDVPRPRQRVRPVRPRRRLPGGNARTCSAGLPRDGGGDVGQRRVGVVPGPFRCRTARGRRLVGARRALRGDPRSRPGAREVGARARRSGAPTARRRADTRRAQPRQRLRARGPWPLSRGAHPRRQARRT